jgi:hypothetical protein
MQAVRAPVLPSAHGALLAPRACAGGRALVLPYGTKALSPRAEGPVSAWRVSITDARLRRCRAPLLTTSS